MMAEVNLIGKNKIKSAITGEIITVDSLWEKQPVVIVFFRRFGCMFCRVAAQEISAIKEDLDANNVRLVGIGVEDVGKEEFMQKQFFKGDLYIDENKKCYEDLKYNRLSWFGLLPALISKASRAIYYNGGTKVGGDLKGDYYQVGGALVISEGGDKVLLSHKQETLSDFVDCNEILKSLGIQAKEMKLDKGKEQCNSDEASACN